MVVGRAVALIALIGLSPMVLIPSASATTHPRAGGCTSASIAAREPSRQAPPGVHWLRGYSRIYCTDFPGANLPRGWGRFSGVPHGDPSSMFDPSHVVVRAGILSLNTTHDPANGGKWATGGVCQCSLGRTYGAYLVRSRLTGAGDDEVQMLWPVAHVWPPEVDFNETGNRATKTAWYVHFRSSGHQIAKTLRINLTRWHTWGVRWTARQLTFTVDGHIWGIVRSPSVIPHERMTLDMSQQTWCGIAPECPKHPVSMQVDWVAIFAPR
jgi:Glycosyl hydrolases family 16